MLRLTRGKAISTAALLLVAVLSGCGGPGNSVDDPDASEQTAQDGQASGNASTEVVPPGKAPESVTIALRDDVDTFNPAKAVHTMADLAIEDAVYGTLVTLSTGGPEAGGVLPNLASSWTVNSPTSVTFEIHDGLTCEDGTPLPPSGIAESIEWLGAPETGATFYGRMFGTGEVTVEADDEANTLTVNVSEPYSYLLEGLSIAYIPCPNALDDEDALAQRPAGTGPYAVVSIERGQAYVLERRDDFAALPPGMTIDQFPKTLTMRVVSDESATASMLTTGEVDIGSLLGHEATRARAVDGLEEVTGAAFAAGVLLFNQSDGMVGSNPAVRRAIAHAVDAEDWSAAASFGVSPPISTIYTPNMPCYDEGNSSLTPEFDLEKAREVLEEDGWSAGPDGVLVKDGEQLTVRVLGTNQQGSGPEYLAANLEELGANVDVTNGTFTSALNTMFGSGDWDLFVFPFSGEIYVPSQISGSVTGTLESGSVNVGHIQNEEYEARWDEAVAVVGQDACAVWSDAEAALLTEVDAKPLMWETAAWFGREMTFQAQFWKMDLRTIRATADPVAAEG